MATSTHFLITNRETSAIGGDNFVPANATSSEFLRKDGRESAQDSIRFGEVTFEEGKKKYRLDDFKLEMYPDLSYDQQRNVTNEDTLAASKELASYKLFSNLYEQGKKKKDILFFIHGFKNDLEVALCTLAELHQRYVVPDENPIKHIVMFTWPARKNVLAYRDDARDAELSGYALARAYRKLKDFFRILVREKKSFCDANIHLMCHSMGNRVLESMLRQLFSDGVQVNNLFQEALLVGSDIDYDAFEAPKPINRLIDLCGRIHVYYHNNDRALLISENTKNAFNRLGLWGARDSMALPDDVYQCDVTDIRDEEDGIFDDIMEKVIHHWYYVNSGTVIDDIVEVLNGGASAFSDDY